MDDLVWKDRHALIFRARLSVIYHRRRERLYELMDRIAKSIAVIGGSALVFQFTNQVGLVALGFVVLLASTLSLVFQFSSRATSHAGLAKDWSAFERDMVLVEDISAAQICIFDARAATLDGLEPRTLRALVADCQNELARAEGQEDVVRPIKGWRWLAMHFFDIEAPGPINKQPNA